MTATIQAPEQKLTETIGKLETSLLTPVIAGEFSMWVQAVQESAATLAMDLASYLRTILHVQYAEIVRTDPEMSAHVEKLIAGDQQVLERMTRFHEDLHALSSAAEH